MFELQLMAPLIQLVIEAGQMAAEAGASLDARAAAGALPLRVLLLAACLALHFMRAGSVSSTSSITESTCSRRVPCAAVDAVANWDWVTVAAFTCAASCGDAGSCVLAEEHVVIVLEHECHTELPGRPPTTAASCDVLPSPG